MKWLKKLLFPPEYKVIMKPHVIKGRLVTVYLNNGDELSELIKDDVKFYDQSCNMLNDTHYSILYRRLQTDSICIKSGNGNDILLPKTSILKIIVGLEQSFETVEVYSHLE